jgi:hypothetical protein
MSLSKSLGPLLASSALVSGHVFELETQAAGKDNDVAFLEVEHQKVEQQKVEHQKAAASTKPEYTMKVKNADGQEEVVTLKDPGLGFLQSEDGEQWSIHNFFDAWGEWQILKCRTRGCGLEGRAVREVVGCRVAIDRGRQSHLTGAHESCCYIHIRTASCHHVRSAV